MFNGKGPKGQDDACTLSVSPSFVVANKLTPRMPRRIKALPMTFSSWGMSSRHHVFTKIEVS